MSAILPPDINKNLVPLPIRASEYHQDPLVYVGRQTKHIERNLQVLIDAQSEGLLAGLGGSQPEGSVSDRSYTPVSEPSSSRGLSTVPIRQPPTKKIGLRAARDGIFKSIYDLLKLREEEREILGFRVEERDHALNEIDTFNTKRAGLEKAISTIDNNRDSQRSKELRDEGFRLESEIHELENKLAQMKARHRHVTEELLHIENTVESKLSSYKASLSLLESNVRKFLQNPPVKPQANNPKNETFYSLKSNRRTLDMAQEHWKMEQSDLRQRQTEVDGEIAALEEGGGVWKQVFGEVSSFERRLRSAMRQSMQSQSQLLASDGPSQSKQEEDLIRNILEDLGHTTDHVEHHLQYSEEKDWKLLVCCISAELQALREAREMLLSAFNVTEEDLWPPTEEPQAENSADDIDNSSQTDPLGVDNPEPPADLLRDARHSNGTGARSEDEDDEPDPAWLLPES